MAISVENLLSRAGTVLLDEDHVRWTEAELIDWINEARGALVNLRPASGANTVVVELQAGTYQHLPVDGSKMIEVIRNVGANDTPGRVIRRTDRALMDRSSPDWHMEPQRPEARQYMFDERTPRDFYVYPPVLQGTKVQMAYAVIPPKVSAKTDTLQFGEEYADALLNYVLYRANCKDSEYSNGQLAMAYYSAFASAIGVQITSTAVASPNPVPEQGA